MTLVGVEFIADAATWLKNNSGPPVLRVNRLFSALNDSPNRYNILPFFELHVWAWRTNPKGPFMDWNDNVTCAGPAERRESISPALGTGNEKLGSVELGCQDRGPSARHEPAVLFDLYLRKVACGWTA